MVLETLLGSCVAVCLHNIKSRRSAMNHFLLDRQGSNFKGDFGRFGNLATEHIIRYLFDADNNVSHYRAQVFGGAAVFKGSGAGSRASDIGRKNVEVALEVLKRYRIRVIHAEVYGERGRRIRFHTKSNVVDCRFTGDVRSKPQAQSSG